MRGKVETVVWSERMLAALVSGVKGGKWFSLWDKVWRRGTLERAWELVSKNKGAGGVDGVSRCNYHQQDLTRLMTKSFQHPSIFASLSSGLDRCAEKDRLDLKDPNREVIKQIALIRSQFFWLGTGRGSYSVS